MSAVIFANGELLDEQQALRRAALADIVIAADGGARHCLALNIVPQFVIGDLDSLNEVELRQLEEFGAEIIKHEIRKDETDLELAFLHALQLGINDVTVLAGLGGRWDMSLSNLLLPAYDKLHGLNIHYVHGNTSIFLVRDEVSFEGQPGDTVSLVPVGGDVTGITTKGLEYPLQDEHLYLGATRGISNQMTGTTATVNVKTGLLLCIIEKH
ncbi:MAG: thiamine diphosphokinase [Chloroflexi bacterium]|nr:thiamine diphosphokinase [Chloroflexota bacterium]